MFPNKKEIGQVLSCSPRSIGIEISSLPMFEEHKESLQIGRYLKIAQGNRDHTIAIITNVKGSNEREKNKEEEGEGEVNWKFEIECQPVGTLDEDGNLDRGSILLPVPTEPVFVADEGILEKLFAPGDEYTLPCGRLAMNNEVTLHINGNKFFGKHVGIAGSTGSGKSCTVASLLQTVVGIKEGKNANVEHQKNAHIVIFDIHSEYKTAFTLESPNKFNLNILDIDTIQLPYWLMNSEELESIFIESNESNSHNQVSQFKHAVILNKEKHNPNVKDITYDTPVYFSIKEVYNYISNINSEVIGKMKDENLPKLSDETLVKKREDYYFDEIRSFVPTSTRNEGKASKGPFHGEFNRFCSRMQTRLADKRLRFLLSPTKEDGSEYSTDDFGDIVRQILGYIDRSNVTVVDLSGIPFEVLSITVSLIGRLIFDFCFHYSKMQHKNSTLNDVPVMLVCEEAHNYVPQSDVAAYRASRKSIERIAKEGRKYGLSLMAVSQRPSEVSETIFAQCNNFLALRLTNNNDQNYIRKLLPENLRSVTDALPNLGDGECIVVGDSVLFPAIVQLDMPTPEPQSQTVNIFDEWNQPWKNVSFDDVIKRWRKE